MVHVQSAVLAASCRQQQRGAHIEENHNQAATEVSYEVSSAFSAPRCSRVPPCSENMTNVTLWMVALGDCT